MSESTNCLNCGAPTHIDPATGARRCRHCGTVESQPVHVQDLESGEMSSAKCPVCDTPLREARLETHPLKHCERCQGMLIGMDRFVSLIEAARARETVTGVSLPRQQRPGERELACPTCGRPMHAHVYAGPGNLVIDTCETCAVNWLDGGELRRIARAPQGRVWNPPPPLETPDPGKENEEE